MKEFMVFNTNSDILTHIIEQALRQRALLAPSWALIAIPTFCCLWQHWRCKLLIPKDSDCEVNLPFHFVLNRHWVEVPFPEATKLWSWSAIATKLWKCEAEVGKYLCYQVLLPLLLWLPLEIPGLVVPIYTATLRYIPLHYSAASFTWLFVCTIYNYIISSSKQQIDSIISSSRQKRNIAQWCNFVPPTLHNAEDTLHLTLQSSTSTIQANFNLGFKKCFSSWFVHLYCN